MSLAPLLDAVPAIPVHAFAAMTAFVLGVVQLAAPKGTLPHRALGWVWVLLMLSVAISSFWIHQIRLVGPWSPIHLLSIFTLVMLPLAVWKAHTHQVTSHRRAMIFIFTGALLIAGLFTRCAAFVMSGEMAFAYFISHAPNGFFPIINRGDAAILYCFVFLYIAFAGAGPWSLDTIWRKKT